MSAVGQNLRQTKSNRPGSLAMKTVTIISSVLLAVFIVNPARSQQANYPIKVVHWIAATAAGSPSDVMVRKFADAVQPKLGATIIVENKPGASGAIGSKAVATASPDGYTLLVGLVDPLISSVALMKSPPYDPTKDFRFVTKLISGGAVLLASKDFKPSNLKELIEAGRTTTEPINYGTIGPVSFTHYVMEAFAQQTGAKLKAIHYRSNPQAMQGLIGNEISLFIGAPAHAASMITDGRIKALAVFGNSRAAPLPNVPTFAEAGTDGFVFRTVVNFGMFAPAKTPDAVINKLVAAVKAAAAEPELQKFVAEVGFELVANSPAEFEQEFRTEHREITQLIRDLGISAE